MSVSLNHMIVWSSDRHCSARFLADMLGLTAPSRFGHFAVIELDNGVSLDFADHAGPIQQQHLAFVISEEAFDSVLARIRRDSVPHWADPMRASAGVINHNDGGRGVYFADPDDHLLEVITRPYGSADQATLGRQ